MDLFIPVDASAGVPLHRQVYDGIRTAILDGNLHPGDRLPPTRSLADQLSLSRQTVTEAYEQLRAEGYIHGRQGSGTFVAPDLPDGALRAPVHRVREPSPRSERLSAWGRFVAAHAPSLPDAAHAPVRLDLRPHRVASGLFPWEAWAAAVDRALVRSRDGLAFSAPPEGHHELREAISNHLALYRGVDCTPDQVVIVSGSQQGLNLLAHVVLEAGDAVAVEDPGYPAARLSFSARGLKVRRVPVDEDGMAVDDLPRSSVRLIHVTPSHQDPTGATLSLGRRVALLRSAQRNDALIFEDDYDSEFRYEGRPVESLQGLDGDGRVVYAGTFSKSVLPGLRIGYLVLPVPLIQPFVAAKRVWDSGTPMLEQAALAEFLRCGEFERHIRRMRRVYRARRDALLLALRTTFGDRVQIGPRHGGLNLLIELSLPGSAEQIAAWAESVGVAIRPATTYFSRPPAVPTFLLGFGAGTEQEIMEAVSLLGQYPVG